jgi:hypothetical protein
MIWDGVYPGIKRRSAGICPRLSIDQATSISPVQARLNLSEAKDDDRTCRWEIGIFNLPSQLFGHPASRRARLHILTRYPTMPTDPPKDPRFEKVPSSSPFTYPQSGLNSYSRVLRRVTSQALSLFQSGLPTSAEHFLSFLISDLNQKNENLNRELLGEALGLWGDCLVKKKEWRRAAVRLTEASEVETRL